MTDKKERILHSAITLFSSKGVAVPTAQIAKEAGVSNGTLFNNYATKQALIDAVYLHIKYSMAETLLPNISDDAPLQEMFATLWGYFIQWGVSHPLEHDVMLLLKSSNAISSEVTAKGENIFAATISKMSDAIARKELINIPVQYMCELSRAQLTTAISYAQRAALTGAELKKHSTISFEIFWKGIAL